MVVRPDGHTLAAYDKQHLSGYENDHFTAGDHGASLTVDGWELGLSICYDGCFPEHARAAADDGALGYLNSAAYFPGGEHRRDIYYPARALDNGIFVVFAGLTGSCGASRSSAALPSTTPRAARSPASAPSPASRSRPCPASWSRRPAPPTPCTPTTAPTSAPASASEVESRLLTLESRVGALESRALPPAPPQAPTRCATSADSRNHKRRLAQPHEPTRATTRADSRNHTSRLADARG